MDLRLGNHREEREVDGVHAFAQRGPLPAALARLLTIQERIRILKVVTLDHAAKRLARGQWLTVTGIHVADLALRNVDEPHFVHSVLPSPQIEVDTTAQQPRLIAGLAIERNDPTL